MPYNAERGTSGPDAAHFQAPAERASKRRAHSGSDLDVEPTPEQLQFYRDMTQEEWSTIVAEGNKRIAGITTQGQVGRLQGQESSRQKWERRIRALESVRPSGDPARDAIFFFEAISLDPNTLTNTYAEAYRQGNKSVMLRYFKEVARQSRQLPPTLSDGVQHYFQVFDQVVRQIVAAAESDGVKE